MHSHISVGSFLVATSILANSINYNNDYFYLQVIEEMKNTASLLYKCKATLYCKFQSAALI
jgi:hypothetical protein